MKKQEALAKHVRIEGLDVMFTVPFRVPAGSRSRIVREMGNCAAMLKAARTSRDAALPKIEKAICRYGDAMIALAVLTGSPAVEVEQREHWRGRFLSERTARMDILERMAEALGRTRADVANSMGLSPDVSETDAVAFLANLPAERERLAGESRRVERERQKIMGQLRQIEHDQAAVQLVANALGLPPDSTAADVVGEIENLTYLNRRHASEARDRADERTLTDAVADGVIPEEACAAWRRLLKHDHAGALAQLAMLRRGPGIPLTGRRNSP